MTRPTPERVESLLARAERLLSDASGAPPPPLDDDRALRAEAERIVPVLEGVVGRRYGRLPHIGYRRGVEARLAGPWSQYLTLGVGPTRIVRMTAWESARPAIPAILAHELAHRFAFDESVTTLRGLETSARAAEAGDPRHGHAARLELLRLALGSAMQAALAAGIPGAVDAFFARAGAASLERSRRQWERLRAGAEGGWALTVYASMPCAALETAVARGAACSERLPLPRFRIDSAQAGFCALITAADALTGRRRAQVPLDATLRLWARVA